MLLEFYPEYSSWADWNGNLIHYFAEQQFPDLPEDRWTEVANAVTTNPVFDKFAVPSPYDFADWQEWARALTVVVNGA